MQKGSLEEAKKSWKGKVLGKKVFSRLRKVASAACKKADFSQNCDEGKLDFTVEVKNIVLLGR